MSEELVARWRSEAKILRRRGATPQAEVLEGCAQDLEHKRQDEEEALLTIQEAAAESGYSAEYLRRQVREDKLPAVRHNGPRSNIKLRRRDLPAKAGHRRTKERNQDTAYDPEEDARDIAQHLGR
jgi:hypothetical protein